MINMVVLLLQAKHDVHNKLQNALAEIEALQEQLEDEQAAKQDFQNKYSRANADAQQWKNKYDMEGTTISCVEIVIKSIYVTTPI